MERQTAKELHLLNRKGVTIDELRELSGFIEAKNLIHKMRVLIQDGETKQLGAVAEKIQLRLQKGYNNGYIYREIFKYRESIGQVPISSTRIRQLYITQNKTIREIADVCFCSVGHIAKLKKKYKIKK